MHDLGKLFGSRAADPMGRGVRVIQRRIGGLERAQLALEHIVIIVRDLGRILVIVFFIVVPELLAQRQDFLLSVHTGLLPAALVAQRAKRTSIL